MSFLANNTHKLNYHGYLLSYGFSVGRYSCEIAENVISNFCNFALNLQVYSTKIIVQCCSLRAHILQFE